ncbi:MAG: hypothetical protein ACOX8U_11205, partial [Bradymonadia bacterium]
LNEFRAKNLHKRFYYSVETPTTKVYRFKDKKAKVLNNPKEGDSDYRSARTDLCIYNLSFQRLYLIEFKANNVGAKELFQDFLKLSAEWQEKIINCYFIAVVDRHDNNTINNINKKVREAFVCLENKYKDEIHENASFIAYFFFYTLNEDDNGNINTKKDLYGGKCLRYVYQKNINYEQFNKCSETSLILATYTLEELRAANKS